MLTNKARGATFFNICASIFPLVWERWQSVLFSVFVVVVVVD